MRNRQRLYNARGMAKTPVGKIPTVKSNPLRIDPSRTSALRRKVGAELRRRYMKLRKSILMMIRDRDVLGLKPPDYMIKNSDWKYETNSNKVKRFRAWLRQQMDSTLAGDALIEQWIQESHGRGAKRAFDELRIGTPNLIYPDQNEYRNTQREEALRRVKTHKATVEKVKLLAGRVFTDLDGINAQMSSRMSRILAEGLVKGWTPTKIANAMSKAVSLSLKQALAITRSELIRAHAEGNLDGLADQGETRVTAQVEFLTADDERVCTKCRSLEGRVYRIEDARGVIPVHPMCRCTWLPVSKRSQRKLVGNAFCPTGKGGGINPHCPSHVGSKAAQETFDNAIESSTFTSIADVEERIVTSGLADEANLSGMTLDEAKATLDALQRSLTISGKDFKWKAVEVLDKTRVDLEQGGCGWDGNRLVITKKFLDNARLNDPARIAKQLEGTGGQRNFVWQDGKNSAECVALAVAHETGHFVDASGFLNLQGAYAQIIDKGVNLSEDERAKLSGYATSNISELFAEAHAAMSIGKSHLLPPSVADWYRRAVATIDPDPIFTRNAFCPTGDGGGINPHCSPTHTKIAQETIEEAKNVDASSDPVIIAMSIHVADSYRTTLEQKRILTEAVLSSVPNAKVIHRVVREKPDWEVGEEITLKPTSFTKIDITEGKSAGQIGWKSSDEALIVIENPKRGLDVDYSKVITSYAAHTGYAAEQEIIVAGRYRLKEIRQVTEPGTNPNYGYKVPQYVLTELPTKPPVSNAFCPTGDGGGIDPTCPPKEGKGGSESAKPDKKRSEGEVKKDSKGTSGEHTDIKPQGSDTGSGGGGGSTTSGGTPKLSERIANPSELAKENTPNPATGLPRTFGTGGNKVTPEGMLGTPFFHGIDKAAAGIWKGNGNPPKLNDLADMAGAQPGSKVTAKVVEDGKSQSVVPGADKKEIQILVEHGDLGKTMKRRIGRDADGNVFVHNEFIEVWAKGKGTGTDIFGRGVENAKKLGAKYIACHAGKLNAHNQATMNGYVTWPGMGYDESLKSIESYNKEGAAAIRAKFPNAQSIQDVIDADGGHQWWKDNGFDLYHMKFDLTDGSRSMKKFASYLEASKKKRGG